MSHDTRPRSKTSELGHQNHQCRWVEDNVERWQVCLAWLRAEFIWLQQTRHSSINISHCFLHEVCLVNRHKNICTQTKLRINQIYVLTILLLGSEAWTLLQADVEWLEAVYVPGQCQILTIKRFYFMKNVIILHILAFLQSLIIFKSSTSHTSAIYPGWIKTPQHPVLSRSTDAQRVHALTLPQCHCPNRDRKNSAHTITERSWKLLPT